MAIFCEKCGAEMVEDCKFFSYGVSPPRITKGSIIVGKNFAESNITASVCTNCGHFVLYAENYKMFKIFQEDKKEP